MEMCTQFLLLFLLIHVYIRQCQILHMCFYNQKDNMSTIGLFVIYLKVFIHVCIISLIEKNVITLEY